MWSCRKLRIDPPALFPSWIAQHIGGCLQQLPQFTAQLILTLPCVFLNLAIVKRSCYCSFVLFATFIPSINGAHLLDMKKAYVFISQLFCSLPSGAEFPEPPHLSSLTLHLWSQHLAWHWAGVLVLVESGCTGRHAVMVTVRPGFTLSH